MPAVVLILLVLLGLFAPSAGAQEGQHNLVPYDGYLVSSTRSYRHETWRWQKLMSKRRRRRDKASLDPSHDYRRWVNRLWKEPRRCCTA